MRDLSRENSKGSLVELVTMIKPLHAVYATIQIDARGICRIDYWGVHVNRFVVLSFRFETIGTAWFLVEIQRLYSWPACKAKRLELFHLAGMLFIPMIITVHE